MSRTDDPRVLEWIIKCWWLFIVVGLVLIPRGAYLIIQSYRGMLDESVSDRSVRGMLPAGIVMLGLGFSSLMLRLQQRRD